MADCLGRFGRASHSTSKDHSPSPSLLGKSKCISNAKPATRSCSASPAIHFRSWVAIESSMLLPSKRPRIPQRVFSCHPTLATRHDVWSRLVFGLVRLCCWYASGSARARCLSLMLWHSQSHCSIAVNSLAMSMPCRPSTLFRKYTALHGHCLPNVEGRFTEYI